MRAVVVLAAAAAVALLFTKKVHRIRSLLQEAVAELRTGAPTPDIVAPPGKLILVDRLRALEADEMESMGTEESKAMEAAAAAAAQDGVEMETVHETAISAASVEEHRPPSEEDVDLMDHTVMEALEVVPVVSTREAAAVATLEARVEPTGTAVAVAAVHL